MTPSQQFPDARLRNPRIIFNSLIDIENAVIRTAKPAVYPGNAGKDPSSLKTRNG